MIVRIIVNAIAALVGSAIIPGVSISSVWVAIIFSIVLGLLNATLGNLMKLGGCLLNLITFGIFNWIIDVIVILLAGRWVDGVSVSGFWAALFLGLIMSLVSSFILKFTEKDNTPSKKD